MVRVVGTPWSLTEGIPSLGCQSITRRAHVYTITINTPDMTVSLTAWDMEGYLVTLQSEQRQDSNPRLWKGARTVLLTEPPSHPKSSTTLILTNEHIRAMVCDEKPV